MNAKPERIRKLLNFNFLQLLCKALNIFKVACIFLKCYNFKLDIGVYIPGVVVLNTLTKVLFPSIFITPIKYVAVQWYKLCPCTFNGLKCINNYNKRRETRKHTLQLCSSETRITVRRQNYFFPPPPPSPRRQRKRFSCFREYTIWNVFF